MIDTETKNETEEAWDKQFEFTADSARASSNFQDIGDGFGVVAQIPGCPVAIYGFVEDRCFRFYSRGFGWSFALATSSLACFDAEPFSESIDFFGYGRYSETGSSAAGWIPTSQAYKIIKECFCLWKSGRQ